MNKTVKILSVLLIAVMLISIGTSVFATVGKEIDPSTIQANYTGVQTDKVQNLASRIIGWIRNIAAIAAVVIISVLGIKFMIGSTEERAEYKKSFLPLIIGIVVVLAASTIAGWIWSAANI